MLVFELEVHIRGIKVNQAPGKIQQVLVRIQAWDDFKLNQGMHCLICIHKSVVNNFNRLILLINLHRLQISSVHAFSTISAVSLKILVVIEFWESLESWQHNRSRKSNS